MKRVNAYIDGFNVYYGISKYIKDNNLTKSFSWVNPRAVVNHFVNKQNEILEKVYFFSAVPNFKKNEDPQKVIRHKKYYEVLQNYCDIIIKNGHFQKKNKQVRCPPKNHGGCGKVFLHKSHEEKQTDVWLGVQIIRDVFIEKVDIVILVSADSDFLPVVNILLQDTNVKIKVLKPLGQVKNYSYLNMIKQHKNYTVHDILEFHHRTSIIPKEVKDKYNNSIISPYG